MAKGYHTNVNFSNIPERLDDETIGRLVGQLQRTGNCTIEHDGRLITIRDLLIESHIPLVKSLARQVIYHDPQELVGLGLLVLTETIDKFECLKLQNTNVPAYIATTIRMAIRKFLVAAPMIAVKPDAFRKGILPLKRHAKLLHNVGSTPETTISVDIKDALEFILKSCSEHHQIVCGCMMAGGYKLKDMAELCDLHVSRVAQIREEIRGKFNKVWNQ